MTCPNCSSPIAADATEEVDTSLMQQVIGKCWVPTQGALWTAHLIHKHVVKGLIFPARQARHLGTLPPVLILAAGHVPANNHALVSLQVAVTRKSMSATSHSPRGRPDIPRGTDSQHENHCTRCISRTF